MMKQELIDEIMQFRKSAKDNDDKRDAGLPTEVKGVKRIDNLSYGPDPKWNLLDLYLPENVDKPIPTIINIHGGGWCYGTKETYQFYGLNWAKKGFAFVNANYRIAPDVVFPEELDDVDRYIHWVAEHAAEYGLDTQNVFLIGDSAGGQMAEQYATILTNESYRKLFNYELTDLNFRALALNSSANFVLESRGVTEAYFTPEIKKNQREKLDTEKYIQENFLPTYICTAIDDFIRNSSLKFDGFLTAKNVPHICKMYGDEKNRRGHVFLIDQKDEIAKKANDDELVFFQKYLIK
ncbi:alpha/beta hydrolase [Companilactobacillus alimentarius]|uniref:Lipase n=2 Tax=Companilactobacillus alimentarius TaxID=1602 RepID=A0A2K9HRX0_9LACO|nr:alpha/beta hydrolase [Companilactobacillus alimentarius]AUI72772.1 lipase [Companilactobacillus alimentarius DSM 20249]MDT6951385.1 alpha/beta hydrolase [Companilactobacillus alimentarius]